MPTTDKIAAPVITGPGEYRQADNGKAEVVSIRGERCIGWDSGGKAVGWFLDGRPGLTEPSESRNDSPYRLIAPWTAEPAKESAFEVGQRVRCIRDTKSRFHEYTLNKGMELTVAWTDGKWATFKEAYESYPVQDFEPLAEPAPFRIDRTGVYEQSDGGEAIILEEMPDRGFGTWSGTSGDGVKDRMWDTNGDHAFGNTNLNLIRFLRPLDAPSPEGERQAGDAPVIDAAELKAKAWELVVAGSDVPEAFEMARLFLTEAARREGGE
jgi:hypothetical protein